MYFPTIVALVFVASGCSVVHGKILSDVFILYLNDSSIPDRYKELPVVGKCCPLDEVLTRDEDGVPRCKPSKESFFAPLFSKFNRTGLLAPGDQQERFVAIIGDPCYHKKYMLAPKEDSDDENYLLMNGSVFAPHHFPRMLMPASDYCMETIPGLGLRTFVCFSEEPGVAAADSRITFYASGLLISVPFFVLTILAYSITPKLKDVHGKALCHYCGCLAVAFTALAVAQLARSHLSDQACTCIAFVIQFSFVASFFWLNVICVETWSLVRCHVERGSYTRIEEKTLFFYYSLWAWGPPAVLVLISMAMNLSPTVPATYVKPSFGSGNCCFKSDDEAIPYYYVPVGLLLLCDLILFVITATMITRYQRELGIRRLADNQESIRQDQRLFGRLRRTYLVCVGLFLLIVLNWCMELISWWAGGDSSKWSAFDLINALQGVLVFGLFVLRRPTRDYVWYRIQRLRGKDVVEPIDGSMDLSLLPVMNGDTLTRQTLLA